MKILTNKQYKALTDLIEAQRERIRLLEDPDYDKLVLADREKRQREIRTKGVDKENLHLIQ